MALPEEQHCSLQGMLSGMLWLGGSASFCNVPLMHQVKLCQGNTGPVQASKKNNSSGVGRQPSNFEEFEEDVIGAAHELVAADAAAVRGAMHHDDSSQQEVRGPEYTVPTLLLTCMMLRHLVSLMLAACLNSSDSHACMSLGLNDCCGATA